MAVLISVACAPNAVAPTASPSPSATAAASPSPTPVAVASPTGAAAVVVSPPPAGRVTLSDTALATDARPVLLFQAPGDDRLRGVAWGEMRSGLAGARIPPRTSWAASPDGSRYMVFGSAAQAAVFDRDGRRLGTLPWTGIDFFPVWSRDGRSVCATRPETRSTGAALRFEIAAPGQPARLVAAGFGTYSDNASFPVLACDLVSDRAIVAAFGQGLFAARFWVFRLSTGALLHSEDLGRASPSSWLAASADGMLVAHSTRAEMTGVATAIVRTAESLAPLTTLADFEARGFSDDGHFLVGTRGRAGQGGVATTLVEWRSARHVWSASGLPYGGHLPEPGGAQMAIGLGFTGGSEDREIYLVGPNGASIALLSGSEAPLRY